MKNLLFILIIVLFSSSTIFAQKTAKLLTNQDVIEMTKAGLPETIIISKIKASTVSFKTDIDDLKALTAEKVAENVVSAMIEKSAQKIDEPVPVQSTTESPEFGKLDELKDAAKVYLYAEDIKSRQIIVGELSKYPRLQIVDNKKDAEFILSFIIGNRDRGASVMGNTVTKDIIVIGELYAVRRGRIENNKQYQRIVWQARKVQDFGGGFTFNRHPALNAIKDFLKDLKKLRGEK